MQRILVIEDSPQNARVVQKVLERAGHQVTIASDGETGLTRAFEVCPDLILIDLGLPDIDGQTVITLLRDYPQFAYIPIVVFTGWPEDYAVDMAKRYNCDGIILKPFGVQDFKSQIDSFLNRASV